MSTLKIKLWFWGKLMSIYFLDLITNIILNSLDVLMFYILICGFLCKENDIFIKDELKKNICVNYKKVLLLLSFGIIGGFLATFLTGEIYKICVHILVILFIIFYFKRTRVQDIVIIYLLTNTIILCVQFVFSFIIQFLPTTNIYFTVLLTQMITVSILFYVFIQGELWRIYFMLEREIILQLLFFIFNAGFFSTLIIYNLKIDSTYKEVKILWYFFGTLISLLLYGMTIYKLKYYTKQLPKKYHEVKNVLSDIYIAAYTKDIIETREAIEHSLNILEIHFDPLIDLSKENRIIIFVRNKLKEKNIDANVNFSYKVSNLKILDSTIIVLLGILLDNAIDASIIKDIRINIKVDKFSCIIEVYNDISFETNENEINYAIHSKERHGFGLKKLNDIVNYIHASMDISFKTINDTKYIYFKIEA